MPFFRFSNKPPDVEKLKARRDVKGLIRALHSDEPYMRKLATIALGQVGDARAIKPLIAAFHDVYDFVGQEAAAALDKLGWKPGNDQTGAEYWIIKKQWQKCTEIGIPAIEPLLAAFKNSYRKEMVAALAAIGAPAVEPLIAALKDADNPNVREAAADALGQIGDARVIEPLVAALDDRKTVYNDDNPPSNYGAGWKAMAAVIRIGAPAIPSLIAALTSPDTTQRKLVTEVLEKLGWQPDASELGAAYWITQNRWDKCREIGAPAVGPLIEALKVPDNYVQADAVKTLGDLGDARAIEPLIVTLNEFRFRDIHTYVQQRAADALDRLGWKPGSDETGAMYWLVRHQWNKCVEIGAPAVGPMIARLGVTSDSIEEIPAMANALVQIGEPALQPLISFLNESKQYVARAEVARALGRLGGPKAIHAVKAALKDPDPLVREAAAEALKRLGC